MWRLSFSILLLLYLTASSSSEETCSGIVPLRYRNDKISITDFGGVGDGRTVNTKAFRAAIYRIQHLRRRGGTLLYIPPGVYLTESFNLTSHMTLYLARGAVIRAVQDTWNWPLIDPLPSYGRGRELPGGRYMSFIHGDGLHDVVITGQNGTIDGQGEVWWNMWRSRTLKFTRPNLIEFKNSKEIIISNVIFQNSPFWNIHPVYCSNVVIHHVTILAPQDSPNTDGIDPDSSVNVCIEDSYISTGDDLVAIKSGWDEYGIAFGRPSSNITIRRITGSSPFAGIAIGSETSGGIKNIVAEHITLSNMGVGVNIKTNIGRGGYIKNIKISDVYVDTAKYGIKIAGDTGDHPDAYYNPNALPVVKGIHIKNVWGVNVRNAGSIQGLKGSPFTGKDMLSWEQKTLLSELLLGLEAAKKLQARLRQAPSSSFSSPAAATAETNEILMKQIVSSYERSVLMLNWSPSVQLIPAPVTLVPVENSGGVPESPASINGSPRSEEFADGGGGSSESHHRQDYIFNSKKRKMLPKWSEKVRISPERGLEGPQDDVFSWRKYGQKDILGAKFPRSYYRCTHRSTQNCWATKQVQRSDSDPTVFEVTYRGTHTCSQAIAPPPPPASPEKQKDTITQKPKDLLQSLKSNLTVQTDGLDDGKDVFSFPDTPPFYTYDTINGDFSHVESSPIFDVVDWFNPTVEIDTTFPTFLHESIYF